MYAMYEYYLSMYTHLIPHHLVTNHIWIDCHWLQTYPTSKDLSPFAHRLDRHSYTRPSIPPGHLVSWRQTSNSPSRVHHRSLRHMDGPRIQVVFLVLKVCKKMMKTQTYLTTKTSNFQFTWDFGRPPQITIRPTQEFNAVFPRVSKIIRVRHNHSIRICLAIVEVCKRILLLVPFIEPSVRI